MTLERLWAAANSSLVFVDSSQEWVAYRACQMNDSLICSRHLTDLGLRKCLQGG